MILALATVLAKLAGLLLLAYAVTRVRQELPSCGRFLVWCRGLSRREIARCLPVILPVLGRDGEATVRRQR